MWGRPRGRWRFLVIAVITVATAGLLYWGTRSTFVAGFGGFVASVLAIALTWIGWAWGKGPSSAGEVAADQDLNHIADLLATAVKDQWTQEAGERGLLEPREIPVSYGSSSLPLAGPAAAAAASRQFDPLPGLAPAGEAQLAVGKITDLHAVYGGLGSGRLVIAGPWGAGKSGAGVLLVLAALKYRQCDEFSDLERWKVPVPVLFTGQDWDPQRQKVTDWLAGRMQETYPGLFAGKTGKANAAALIAAGKIALILDGLDEIAKELRPDALQALSQQARFRLVLLTRPKEMASAAAQRGLVRGAAAIELRPIDATTAADYLEGVQVDPPPDGWGDLIGRMRASPESPLADALNSPLTLTLVRDTLQAKNSVREMLDFCDQLSSDKFSPDKAAEEITGYLLDRVLLTAYARRYGEPLPRYDLQTARKALAEIAAQMNQDHVRDLQWWRLPAWAPARPRAIFCGLVVGLVVGLAVGLVFGRWGGFVFGLGAGLATGVGAGLAVGYAGGHGVGTPRRIGRLRITEVLSEGDFWETVGGGLLFGGVVGLVVGLVFGLGFGLAGGIGAGCAGGGIGGLVIGLAGGLAAALEAGLVYSEDTSSPSPVVSWRNDRSCALQVGLVGGLVAGLVSIVAVGILGSLVGHGLRGGLSVALASGPAVGVPVGLACGLMAGLLNSQVWSSSLAAAQLAIRWHTPMRLMRFLDDAHRRSVLRTVGPVYQFRHARLQDRLARTNDDRGNNSNTASDLTHTNNPPGNES